MCGGSKPKIEKAPTPPSVTAPIEADAQSKQAGEEERRKRRAAAGRSDTILTGGLGDTGQAVTGGKRLLGQ